MIKIDKDLTAIPTSLKPNTADYFPSQNKHVTSSKTTHQRRQEIIENGRYINRSNYNSRYKCDDIKQVLDRLYHKKCAFCEQRSEKPHVEHFRPKNIYYWLAYSWDNLLLACASCNSSKGQRFHISGIRYNFVFDPDNTYRTIHASCAELDVTEQPLLVNPEAEDLVAEMIFDQNGGVRSDHVRMSHTIEECKLSRHDLKYQRKKLLDDFSKDIEAALLLNDPVEQKTEIGAFVKQFLRQTHDSEKSFLAFRKYVITNEWLGQIIKDLN